MIAMGEGAHPSGLPKKRLKNLRCEAHLYGLHLLILCEREGVLVLIVLCLLYCVYCTGLLYWIVAG